MDVKALDALGAYNKTSALKEVGAVPTETVNAAEKAGFASMVEEGLGSVMGATSGMESAVAGKLNGQAQLLDVVTAVTSAEMAVETVVAVRDKVLSAYNDIIKMPI
ncbi:MAG: flagellar hook-basal body complex protein FliE [Pseudomonadota bacterium]